MKKTNNTIRYVTIGLGFIAFLLFVLPLFEGNGNIHIGAEIILGLKTARFDIFSLFAFLFPLAASVVLLIKSKYSESLATMFFLLAGFSFILLPDFLKFTNESLGLTIISTTYIISIVVSLLGALLGIALAIAKNAFTTYQIVEMAMLVSLAIVLDLPGLKIRIGASGGSISFTMLPLFVLALRQGPIKGFIGAGIVYGFVTCILDGWGLVYYPFDYLLGYGSMAILGTFRPFILAKNIERFNIRGLIFLIIGVLVSVSGRLLASTLSGIIYYELNFVDSLLYNIAYILPSAGIVLGLLIAIYHPLIRMDRAISRRNG